MKKFNMLRILSVSLLLHTGVSLAEEVVKDVLEGQDVVLECRFSPSDVDEEDGGGGTSTLYWIRSSQGHFDNVAIGNTQYSSGYTVDHEPELGRYDLRIKNATYDRDNGAFECRKVESGSGRKLHSSTIDLVVLLAPSPPILSPVGPTVTEGKAFNLSCASVGGSPPPEITWYRIDASSVGTADNDDDDDNNRRGQQQQVREGVTYLPGRNRQEATTSVLTVIPRKEDDGSEYRCTVWNRAIAESELMEASTSIDVNYFARVQVGPENPIMVERDDTAELKCEVDSKPTVSEVKWMRDGRFIDTNFRHTIPRANIKDAGPYICSADNGLGQIGKAELQLDVLFGPEVTVPTQKEFAEGEEVVVECQVSSNPRPHAILWTKDDDPEFRQAGSTLRIAANSPAAAVNGRYTCSATNVIQPTGRQRMERHGNASIVIAVRHAPGAAFIAPDQPTALEGKSVTLECGARPPGFPLPTYRWWRGNGGESSQPPANSAVLATGSTYTIDSVRLESGGQYLCQPTNELGAGSVAAAVLQVLQEPRLTSQLAANMVKRAGDTGFSVICSARGKPKPRVTWLKDGAPIDEATSNLYQISVTEQEVRSNEAAYNVLTTLKFVGPDRIAKDQLMATDRGQYACVFENDVGRIDSTLQLRIEHSPVVRHLHNKVAADIGETARIACRMQAYPGLRFEWSRGNSLLSQRPPYSINVTELGDDIYESVLEIDQVDENSYDEYACKASNPLGGQKTLISLQPKGRPERPKDVRAVDKGAEWVLLEWEAGFDGGYNTTTYNVEFKELGEGGASAKYADCRWRNPCNLTGLSQYTRYQFRVRAVNIRGDSEWSRDISVTTPVDVARIPTPVHVFYETSSRSVAFNVVNSGGALVGLVAKIELENPDGSWRPHAQLGMDDLTYGEMPISDPDVIGLRIRLCVNPVEGLSSNSGEQQQPLCGDYGAAEIVEVRSGFYGNVGGSGSGLPLGGVIAIAVFASLLALATLALAVKCCCCNNNAASGGGVRSGKKTKKISKDDITAPKGGLHHNGGGYNNGGVNLSTLGSGYNNGGGLDNKGVSAKDLAADSPDIIKSQMYGYNYGAAMPAAQVAPTGAVAYDQSSSNSNNGGSVNSQDSLWNVKHPNGDPMLLGSQQQYGAPYYDQQQQYVMQQQQQQYNYEEYAHYPHPEEYMNERNRAYFHHNGEQYAMPSKQQQQRHRLDSDYSPYGDVSGLPDPYTGHDISDELRAQASADGLSFHSHETDLGGSGVGNGAPEGYSTPSRRVIREIIV